MTTNEYLTDMRLKALEYTNKWFKVATTFDKGYNMAYNRQRALLKAVRVNLEKAQAREAAMISFTLNLISGAILGPIAGRLAEKFVPKPDPGWTDPLIREWSRALVSKTVSDTGNKLRDLGIAGLVSDKPSENAFEPTEKDPLAYILDLQQGILDRSTALSDMAVQASEERQSLPVDQAKQMHDEFLLSTFFTKLPWGLDQKELEKSAELGLWMAWASVRDREYWEKQNALRNYAFSEVHLWGSLRERLIELGVPAGEISAETMGRDGMAYRFVQVINMTGVIRWAKSPQAVDLVTTNIQGDDDGLERFKNVWLKTGAVTAFIRHSPSVLTKSAKAGTRMA